MCIRDRHSSQRFCKRGAGQKLPQVSQPGGNLSQIPGFSLVVADIGVTGVQTCALPILN